MTEYDLGIVLAVIIALGLFGNCASLLVLLRGKRCKKLFCSAYLMTLAAIDTVILALPAMELCLYLLNNVILRNINQFMCKFLTFFLYYGEQLSSWIVVGVTVTRALGIWMPIRSQAWRNKTTVPYLIIISVVFFIIDLPFLVDAERYTIKLGEDLLKNLTNSLDEFLNNRNGTLITNWGTKLNFTDLENVFGGLGNHTISNDEILTIFDGEAFEMSFCLMKQASIYGRGKLLKPVLVDFCLAFAVPLSIITICNFSIILKLLKSMREIKKTQGGQTHMKDSRVVSLALRIFILSTVHLVSTGPIAIAELMKASSIDSNVFFAFKNIPMYRAFNLLFYLNSGVNFVLYCLFGSEFRQDLYDILRLNKKKIRYIS